MDRGVSRVSGKHRRRASELLGRFEGADPAQPQRALGPQGLLYTYTTETVGRTARGYLIREYTPFLRLVSLQRTAGIGLSRQLAQTQTLG